jgi:hypothetical protein
MPLSTINRCAAKIISSTVAMELTGGEAASGAQPAKRIG